MPVNVGTLVIDLVAGTASFSASMEKMSSLSAKTANDISRSLMKISVAGAAAVSAISGALSAMVIHALDSVDALSKAAQSAGTTAETLSTLQYAASLSNVETESLTLALEKLSKASLAASTGNVELERGFKKLGVTVSDGKGHLKDSGLLYEQLAVKFAGMQDGALKTALAMQLFGKAGAQQIPLLNQLGADLAGVQKEAQQFGLVVGTDVAELAAKAHDNLDRMHQVLKGIGYSILGAVLPAMDELLERLIDTAKRADIPALAKSFGKSMSDAIVAFGNAMAFAAKHVTALKVALEALLALQVGRFLIPVIGDLAVGGWAKVGEGAARFSTNLLGLNRVIPALEKFSVWLAYNVKFVGLLAAEEGVAAAATYALGGAFAALTSPITVTVAAVAALGAGLYLLRDHEIQLGDQTYKLRDTWNAAWIAMGKLFDNVKAIFDGFVGYMETKWKGFATWLDSLFRTLALSLIDSFSPFLGALARLAGAGAMPQWLKDSLNQAKAEREAAEKALTTTAGAKKGPAGAQLDTSGLGKPEKDPYKELLDKLNLAIIAQAKYISVLDATPDKIAAVTAAEKAEALILETNNKLKEKGLALTGDQKAEIRRRVATEESLKAIQEFGKSLVTEQQQSELATRSADALAAAQLRGVDAARRQQVENEIAARTLGKTTEQLRAMAPELLKLRGDLQTGLDHKAVDDLSKSIQDQREQLDLESRQALVMADAWGKGEAAVAAAKIQIQLMAMALHLGAAETALLEENTGKLTAAMKAAAAAAQLAQAAHDLDALHDEAEAQKLLTDAVFGTIDAQRQAEIQVKTLAIDRQIAAATDEKVRAALKAERDQIVANTQAQQAHKDAQDALALRSPWEIYERETEALQKQVEALKKAHGGQISYNEALGIAAKQQELYNKAIDEQIDRLTKSGKAMDGVRAFFLEMQKNAITTGKIIFDALNSAFEKLSDNLANLMTGQKADWGAMLKDIGHQMAKQSTQALLQRGLGALGQKLGFDLGGKKDGQTAPTALWVQLAGAGGPGMPGGGKLNLPNLPGINEKWGGAGDESPGDSTDPGGVGSAMKGIGGFLGKLASIFAGGKAVGGEVEPGSAYLVGERGPELYTPGAAGNIHTADETRGMLAGGGSMHYYTIDARGTDPALTEQRTRQAIIAAHQSAIMTSSQVQNEKVQRMPPQVRR